MTPGWDSSARKRKHALILHASTPAAFQGWVEQTLEREPGPDPSERLLFVNAWNEWAEGNHLEPDTRFGHAYLQAHADALAGAAGPATQPVAGPATDPAGTASLR